MPMYFIYAIGFETILASFEGVIFKVGCETVMWVVSRTSMYQDIFTDAISQPPKGGSNH